MINYCRRKLIKAGYFIVENAKAIGGDRFRPTVLLF